MKTKINILVVLAIFFCCLYLHKVFGQQQIYLFDIITANAISVKTSLGYTTGAGGVVTQLTNKSAGVTLNKSSGTITTHNAALAANTSIVFTVTNNTISTDDVINLNLKSGGTNNSYIIQIGAVANGSFVIHVRNISAGSLAQALVINFVVIKGTAN